MALSRSASGPGGLSINTSSANSLFGNATSQPPPAGGLFGSAPQTQTQTTQPSTSSSLFGNTASSTTPNAGGVFGNTSSSTATTQPQQSSGLFGAATSNQPPAGGGLFGQSTAQQPQQQQQQQTGGGLFGNTNNATQQQQPPQQTSGIFGSNPTSTSQPQQQQQQGGGVFGGSLQPSQPAQSSSGLFGGSFLSKPQPTNTNTTSAFGGSTQQNTNAFGSMMNNQQSTTGPGGALGPGLTLGQSTNQQTLPGVRIDVSNIRGTTRFNDLQEDLQKQITEVDGIIQSYISQKQELDAFMPGHGEMLSNIPNDVKFVTRKYGGVENALRSDAVAIEQVRSLVKQDADNARLSFRAVDNLKLPQQYHTGGLWSSRQQTSGTANTEADGQEIVGFFSKTADEMHEQLKRYERNLTEIELHMHGVQGGLVEHLQRMMATKNGGPSPADEKLAELGAVLRDFEQSILEVAKQVGGAREGMTRLQLGEFMNDGVERNGVY